MSKITREELARRKRVARMKKLIIYGFLVMTLLPSITCLYLIHKVNKLEKRLDYMLSEDGGNYMTYKSSRDALLSGNDKDGLKLTDPVKSVLGATSVDINSAVNTASELDDELETSEVSTEQLEDSENMEDSDTSTDSKDIEDVNIEAVQDTAENEQYGQAEDMDEVSETEADVTDSEAKKSAGRVYLTFDDGPSIYTGQILDILAENDVKATFFVIGKGEEYYNYYRRIVDEGHTLGMHSYTHQYQKLYESVDSFAEEIEDLQELLKNVTGADCHIFRFPGGSSNNVSQLPIENYISYLNEHGINYYDWNALSGDAVDATLSPDQLVSNIMKDVRNNKDSVILMHDLQTTHATVESLQMLIDTLKSEGYEILPIDADAPLIQHVSCNSVEE